MLTKLYYLLFTDDSAHPLIKKASTLPDWHDDEDDDYDEEEDNGVVFGTPAAGGSKPVTAQNSMPSSSTNKDAENANADAARDGDENAVQNSSSQQDQPSSSFGKESDNNHRQ